MGIWEMTVWQLFRAGGPLMVPILLCSILALGIILEKFYHLARIKINTQNLKEEVFHLVKNNKIKEAIQLCESYHSPVAKIIKGGLLKFGASRDEIKEAMEDISIFEIPKLEVRLPALATIAHVSPLLGLLGTVTGMTNSFHTIQVRASTLNPITPGDLAGGIWEALLTTVAGLMVAIPSYVAYNFFISRINSIVHDMEHAATELLNFLSHHMQAVPAQILENRL